jgi:hypothetical protein
MIRHLLIVTALALSPVPLVAQDMTLKATARVIAASEDGAFDGARWVQPLPDGTLIIPNHSEMALELWSHAGTRIKKWGRKGEGPGEFRIMLQGGTAAGGVWVNDAVQQRTTFYDVKGAMQSVVRWPASSRPAEGSPFFLLPNAWLDSTRFLGLVIPLAPGPNEVPIRLAAASVRGGIEQESGLPTQPAPTGSCIRTSPQSVILRCPTRRWAFSPDGGRFAWATQSALDDARGWYRLEVRNVQGTILHTDSVAVTRQVISAAERERLTRSVTGAVQRAGVPQRAAPRIAPLPRYDVSVEDVWVADDGTAWIELPNARGEGVTFHRHVVGRRGVGRWVSPPDFVMLWVGSSTVIGRLVGDDGVSRVVEYTVQP